MDKRFECQTLRFSIVHIYLNYWKLAMVRKPSHRLRAEYNMTERFQFPELTVVNCPYSNIFSDTRNASQAEQLFVSWIQYGQEISMPDLTIVNCPHISEFLETRNGVANQATVCELNTLMSQGNWAGHWKSHLDCMYSLCTYVIRVYQ